MLLPSEFSILRGEIGGGSSRFPAVPSGLQSARLTIMPISCTVQLLRLYNPQNSLQPFIGKYFLTRRHGGNGKRGDVADGVNRLPDFLSGEKKDEK